MKTFLLAVMLAVTLAVGYQWGHHQGWHNPPQTLADCATDTECEDAWERIHERKGN